MHQQWLQKRGLHVWFPAGVLKIINGTRQILLFLRGVFFPPFLLAITISEVSKWPLQLSQHDKAIGMARFTITQRLALHCSSACIVSLSSWLFSNLWSRAGMLASDSALCLSQALRVCKKTFKMICLVLSKRKVLRSSQHSNVLRSHAPGPLAAQPHQQATPLAA